MRLVFKVVVAVFILFANEQASASDIPALQSIAGPAQAKSICEQSCAAHDCAWSGDWKKGDDAKGDSCDCGLARDRHIPGGVIRSEEQAKQACKETCDLNELPWSGKWVRFKGGFDVCACSYVSDWCEPKK